MQDNYKDKTFIIWDRDYFANDKNLFNVYAMKLSSYIKQCGGKVIFVLNKYDIEREAAKIYIFQNYSDKIDGQLNPEFLISDLCEFYGDAFNKMQIKKIKFTNLMLMMVPDYLLYPLPQNMAQRCEQILLFDDEGKLLPAGQGWANSFKRKRSLLVDSRIWNSSRSDLLKALDILKHVKNLMFYQPISIKRILDDKSIATSFLELDLKRGSNLNWTDTPIGREKESIAFLIEVKKKFPTVGTGRLLIQPYVLTQHWGKNGSAEAIKDFQRICNIVILAKSNKIKLYLQKYNRNDSPYFEIFEVFSDWLNSVPTLSLLDYLNMRYNNNDKSISLLTYCARPSL